MNQKINLPALLIAGLIAVSTLTPSTVDAKIQRSQAAKNHFKAAHPCPSNSNTRGPCPGYVIDHIQALACGGADAPSNMQWQTQAEGKAKDKWERDDCQIKASANATKLYTSTAKTYRTSAKGACYTYSKTGKKRYVAHSFCR